MNSFESLHIKRTQNMYDTIQDTLTYLIEAIAILGFCGCWVHYSLSKALDEIASWGMPPQTLSEDADKNYKTNSSDLNESLNPTTLSGLESATTMHSSSIPMNDTEYPKNQEPTFQNYSKTRLRKIARELGVRRFSKMEIPELITAITSHPKAQRVCAL